MKTIFLFLVASLAFAVPAFAQVRLNAGRMNTPSAMVRIPRSSLPGAGMNNAVPTTPTKSTYPKPIRQDYDPMFVDPTTRNPNLRRR